MGGQGTARASHCDGLRGPEAGRHPDLRPRGGRVLRERGEDLVLPVLHLGAALRGLRGWVKPLIRLGHGFASGPLIRTVPRWISGAHEHAWDWGGRLLVLEEDFARPRFRQQGRAVERLKSSCWGGKPGFLASIAALRPGASCRIWRWQSPAPTVPLSRPR